MKEQRKAEEWAEKASTSELIRWLVKDLLNVTDFDPRFAAAKAELDLRLPRRRA